MGRKRTATIALTLFLVIALILLTGLFNLPERALHVNAVVEDAQIAPERYRVKVLSEKMPLSLSYGSAAWDGKSAYVFGGWDDRHASGVILKFDPENNVVTALLDNLPSPRSGTAATYANGTLYNVHNVCYIFGGGSGSGYYDASSEIVRFFPSDGWRDIKYETIPGRTDMSAVWDGRAAYLFGGKEAPGESVPSSFLDEIVEYDPERGLVATLPVKLPHVRADSSAIWDGQNAYVFGGWYINELYQSKYLDNIVRFNPETNEVSIMNAKFPTGRAFTSAVWDGRYAYVFGGRSEMNGTEVDLDEIVRYDPSVDNVQILPAKMPFGLEGAPAVWINSAAYVFGGRTLFQQGKPLNPGDSIVMISVEPESASPLPEPAVILICIVIALAVFLSFSFYFIDKHLKQRRQISIPKR